MQTITAFPATYTECSTLMAAALNGERPDVDEPALHDHMVALRAEMAQDAANLPAAGTKVAGVTGFVTSRRDERRKGFRGAPETVRVARVLGDDGFLYVIETTGKALADVHEYEYVKFSGGSVKRAYSTKACGVAVVTRAKLEVDVDRVQV